MNTKNLIESGQIELYVAEAISADERKLIDELVKDYPQIKEELKEAEDNWYSFANVYSRNPRPQLRKKILDRIVKEGPVNNIFKPESDESEDTTSEIKWWLTAASIGLLIMVSALNYMFYAKWMEAENQILEFKNKTEVTEIITHSENN